MQYQVLLDPSKLAGAGCRSPQVVTALGANNGNAGGGFYSQGGQFYYVRGLGRLQTPEDIGNVVARRPQRHPGAGQGRRPGRHRHRAAARPVRLQQRDDAVEGVILHAQGRAGPGRLERLEKKTRELNRLLPRTSRSVPSTTAAT